jgi:hypothetical protein
MKIQKRFVCALCTVTGKNREKKKRKGNRQSCKHDNMESVLGAGTSTMIEQAQGTSDAPDDSDATIELLHERVSFKDECCRLRQDAEACTACARSTR